MSLLVQGRQAKHRARLRLVAQRLTQVPAPTNAGAAKSPVSRPGRLLLFFDLCGLSGVLLFTLYLSWVSDHLPAGDPVEYHNYAVNFWLHVPRFVEFPKEYPPLSLIPFSLTLFPSSETHYYWVFAGWMSLAVCASYVWMARHVSRAKAITYALYLIVGAMGTLLMRFDLLPALVTLAALILAERGRFAWAYVLLAVGVLLKIYPIFLAPTLLAYQWHSTAAARPATPRGWRQRTRANLARLWGMLVARRGSPRWDDAHALRQRARPLVTGLSIMSGLIALGFSIPASLNLDGTLSTFGYNFIRPIQIESVPATLLWAGSFLGFPADPNYSFTSLNLVGPLDVILKPLSLLGLFVGTFIACRRVLQGKLTLGQAFIATIALVLITNKLLSPQYLMWVLPLVAYVEGFDGLWLLICALTTLIFPFIYQTRHPILSVPTNSAFQPTIAVRNLLLLIATVRAVRRESAQDTHLLSAPAHPAAGEILALAPNAPGVDLSPVPLDDQPTPEDQPERLIPTGR